jgi:alkylation response protein AidB-like acyl-CoA dehydrogenase
MHFTETGTTPSFPRRRQSDRIWFTYFVANPKTDSRETAGPLERARALAPLLEDLSERTEQERRLPEPVRRALFDASLFRLLLPRFLDGGEVDPLTFVQVIEEVAKHDASAAWCLCQASGCSMTAAYLSPEAAREIFGAAAAVLAWGPSNDAKAVAVNGGYRITGTWSFASGCRHATWLGGYCPIREPDGQTRRRPDGTADGRTMLFPAEQATIIDVWHVTGLRGTGSDAFTVTDLFVPHEHTVSRDDPADRRHPGPLYCFPSGSLYAAGFSGVAMGIARSSLDAFIELARDKEPRASKRLVRDSALIQFQVAEAEARLGAARVFLHDALERIWADVSRSGSPLSLEQRVQIRLASTYGIHQAKQVVDTVHHAAGSSAVFTSSAFERRFRDIHTVTQQLQGRQAHFETVGRYLLGLEPDPTFL